MKKSLFIITLVLAALGAQAQTSGDASFSATVYAEQLMTENAAAEYMVKSVSAADGTVLPVADACIDSHITTLSIDASAIAGEVTSVSIFSNKKTAIAGPFKYDAATDKVTTQVGKAPTIYCTNMKSDVVTVVGSDKQYKAYLMPVAVKGGVLVTVRTADGKLYSQNFADDITAGSNVELTMSAPKSSNLWMATIPGNTYFSFISTPGAHDAATSGVGGAFSAFAKCQGEDIATMLQNGVRAFDLRPNYKNSNTITADNLYIYHGSYNTKVKYVDAMQTMVDFLKKNPSEAISVVMIKENGEGSTDRSSEMWSVINACHTQHASYMKLLNGANFTLDDFRGKICYVNRTGTDCTNTVRITNWPDDNTITNYSAAIGSACAANIQDKYNTNGKDKQNEVKAMLDISSQNTVRKNFHYNFTSSAYKILGSSPATYASQTNPVIASYLNDGSIEGPTGYVYADFMGSSSNGGEVLLRAVVDQNYRYVFKGRGRSEANKAEEEETAISAPRVNDVNTQLYDLGGRPLDKAQRGVNIVGGKKLLVK
ncbi:MAG: hypothetical protein KBT39_02105 [Bacteroidales bacterium]|nr:hypothetical protein [Bacteroidales bacterium]